MIKKNIKFCCFPVVLLKVDLEPESAVRGYHYRRYWSPIENETLQCFHDSGNSFDVFPIKTCSKKSLQAVGHLPSEISRLTKFILDRGAEVEARLNSTNYRRSPITQGGLEIPCTVKVKMAATLLNRKLLERYREMVDDLYKEPGDNLVMGSFVFDNIDGKETEQEKNNPEKKRRKDEKKSGNKSVKSSDIRYFFKNVAMMKSAKLPRNENDIVVLD